MTTRRRRAGSENSGEELVSVIPSDQPVLLPQNPLLIQANNSVPWTGTLNFTAQSQAAYYKKTDSPQPTVPLNNPLLVGANNSQTYAPQYYSQQQSYYHQYNPQPTGPVYTTSYAPQYNTTQQTWNQNNNGYEHPSFGDYSVTSISDETVLSKSADLIDNTDMASRDRTQEFVRIIRSQQGSHSNGVVPQKGGRKIQDIRQYTEFMQRAKLIGRNISSTYAKLEKLTHLAKKRSLFDDSPDREIQELTGIIHHDLSSLTKQLEDLRNKSHAQTTISGPAHLQKHSANLVGSLQNKVKSITKKFKDVLEVRTENLKKQAERRDQFTGGIVSGELPSAAVTGHHQGSVLVADEAASLESSSLLGATGGEVAINMGGTYQNQLHLMEEQDTYLQSRADTMKTIESTIVELGQMFTQLATMVQEQGEIVTRIDSNVEDTSMNIEAAHSEILRYFKSVSSNRWLMIKVFGIMIVFFVVFVVFMA